jgi:hypothetical protein
MIFIFESVLYPQSIGGPFSRKGSHNSGVGRLGIYIGVKDKRV